ncbi:heavy metal translocating P-type ATPase [Halocatena marina]|uniref:heavy metal translocating P-type ATPase n=1 Tax=Halocatena marina TaxID=2934937 RepID=UPI00200E31A0|nr:heavy metal translocating P-type ATPase [Halocatena marina]
MDTGSNRRTTSGDGTETASFAVPEMDCPSCAAKITSSVESLAGIAVVDPQVMIGSVAVTYDPKQTDRPSIVDRIEAAGYTVEGRTGSSSQSIAVSVPGMDCPSCANKITTSVQQLTGIHNIDPEVTTGTVHVEYDPSETTVDRIHERIKAAGYTVETRKTEQTDTFDVPEMDCPSCAGKIENALEQRTGITAYETQPTTGTVTVTYDTDQLPQTAVVEAITGAGYTVEGTRSTDPSSTIDDTRPREDPRAVWRSKRALKVYTGATFLTLGIALEYLLPSLNIVLASGLGQSIDLAELFYIIGIAAGGEAILHNGYYSARNRSLDIDLLMSLGILGAVLASLLFGEGLYFEGGTLAVLFSVAQLMERYSMGRARRSLDELMELAPETATVRRDGDEQSLHVDAVQIDDVVIIRPGEKVPMDGEVLEGESAVNQAPITGESVPVDKREGDDVYAGTINKEGYLEVRVTSVAADNTIAQIIEMVEDAQREKTEHEQFVDRFADKYTPVIVSIAVALLFVQPLVLGATWRTGFVQGLTLLVLACPCAMVISTPVSVVSGITSAAKNGVLIKSGPDLEAMGDVDTVAIDKTGTLTKGELTVTDVVPLDGTTREDVLRDARSLEARSEHPISTAIVEAAADEGIDERIVKQFESLTGKGVTGTIDGEQYYIGKPALFEDLGFDLTHHHVATDGGVAVTVQSCEHGQYLDLMDETVSDLQGDGKTVVFVGTADRLVGVIAVADEVRPGARHAIEQLHAQGIERIVMLTGDNRRTAQAIAEQVGVDEYRAELLPEEKATVIEACIEQSEGVAMVGDGINDAPALATATVGIAMGAAGTDTALETADIALLSDDITKLPYLAALSQKATAVIEQNIWGSLGVKMLLAIGVPFQLVSVIVAVVIGDMGMSIGVTANSMRLSRLKPDRFL